MARRLLAAALLLVGCAETTAQSFSMDRFLWTHRPLLIFAPSAEAPDARAWLAAVRRENAGFLERDMVFIEVYGDDRASLDGRRLPAGVGRQLRKRYAVADGELLVVLVGKDGGEKLRTSEDADFEKIFDLIDSMPMRRQEIRQRQSPSTAVSG